MFKFKIGEIVVLHSLPERHAQYNGEEGVVDDFILAGDVKRVQGKEITLPYNGYAVNLFCGLRAGIMEQHLKRKEFPDEEKSQDRINELEQ